jgi:hypothetical protein
MKWPPGRDPGTVFYTPVPETDKQDCSDGIATAASTQLFALEGEEA